MASAGAAHPDPGISTRRPILGICYGTQLFAHLLGGVVARADRREYGIARLEHQHDCDLFEGMSSPTQVWMSHGDRVERLPAGFTAIGCTENSPYGAIADTTRRFYGVQFHPEVVHTPEGMCIFNNFVHKICGCGETWTMGSFSDTAIREIRERVGERKVLCALSGGVDSSVAAALIHRAVGENLTCVFVNNGLLRKNEPDMVRRVFKDNFHINLVYVDAEARFLGKRRASRTRTEAEDHRAVHRCL